MEPSRRRDEVSTIKHIWVFTQSARKNTVIKQSAHPFTSTKKKKNADCFYGYTPLVPLPTEEKKKGRRWRCCHTHHQNALMQRRCVAVTTHLKAQVCAGAVACCKQNEAESYFILFDKRATRVVTANSEGLFLSNVLQAFPFTWR